MAYGRFFYATTPEHLNALLASSDVDSLDPRVLRLAAFQIIDYYQLTLAEAAEIVGVALDGGLPHEAMNVLLASIPQFPPEDRELLTELRKVRNYLDHKAAFCPSPRLLQRYHREAPRLRARLLASAGEVRTRLASLDAFHQALLRAAFELAGLADGPMGTKNDVDLAASATHRAEVRTGPPTMDDIDLYAQLRSRIAFLSYAEGEYYSSMAEDARADELRGMMKD